MQDQNVEFKSKETESSFLKHKRIIGLIAAIALIFAGLGYVGAKLTGDNKTAPEQTKQTVSDTLVPSNEASPEKSATESTSTLKSEQTEPAHDFKLDVSDQYSHKMEIYHEMDIDTFEALPLDERLAYANYLRDKTIGNGLYNAYYGSNSLGRAYEIPVIEPSIKFNNEDLMLWFYQGRQIAELQTQENGPSYSVVYDSNEGKKILSSIYYEVGKNNTTTRDYADFKTHLDELTSPTYINAKPITIHASEIQGGEDSNGNKIQYTDVEWCKENNDVHFFTRFVYHKYISYDGDSKEIWLAYRIEDSQENLTKS